MRTASSPRERGGPRVDLQKSIRLFSFKPYNPVNATEFPTRIQAGAPDHSVGIIWFQMTRAFCLGVARKRQQKYGILQCEVLG